MATLRELIIKISANSQSFQSEIQRASRMGSEYYRTLQNGGRQAAAVAREQRRALAELNSQLTEIRASAAGTAGAFAGAFATGHLISLADEWSSVNARLKQASQSSDEFSSSQKVLMDISQRTGTAFSDNAALFARSAASMREYGYSADDVLKVTEAISTGLKISGASTAEAGSVITQFSQALAQGVLRGEEFNSVNESGDRIVRALAAGMGVARKDLKAMRVHQMKPNCWGTGRENEPGNACGSCSRSATASARRMRTFSLSIRPGISVRIFTDRHGHRTRSI